MTAPEIEIRRQRDYYTATADDYDTAHVAPGDEHAIALEYIAGLARTMRARSVLDVGAGTGRGIRLLRGMHPGLDVSGIEPVDALRAIAADAGVMIQDGDGARLPFADSSIDFVISTGVLHHVRHPDDVVREMCRVARLGVLISDSNRFGQGRPLARYVKFGLHRCGLWPAYQYLRTRGRVYMESAGDGVFYSYSIYDSLRTVARWADRSFVIPTSGRGDHLTGALFTSPTALLVGLREPAAGWAGRPADETDGGAGEGPG
jgi:ubiquinone/menaquinone biosynthesis C-methylase UbiE